MPTITETQARMQMTIRAVVMSFLGGWGSLTLATRSSPDQSSVARTVLPRRPLLCLAEGYPCRLWWPWRVGGVALSSNVPWTPSVIRKRAKDTPALVTWPSV